MNEGIMVMPNRKLIKSKCIGMFKEHRRFNKKYLTEFSVIPMF